MINSFFLFCFLFSYYDTSATTDPNAVAIQADYSQYAAAYQMPQYGEEMHPAQDDLELIGKYIPIWKVFSG